MGIDCVLLRAVSTDGHLVRERWIWWAKRDLRVHDNAALRHIVDSDYECLSLYVLEPSIGGAPETSAFHALAIRDALTDLKQNLQQRGSDLTIVVGETVEVLDTLYRAMPFTGIVSHEETGSDITYQRDRAVAQWAKQHDVQWLEFPQNAVVRQLTSRDVRQQIVWERIWNTPVQRAPRKIIPVAIELDKKIFSTDIPSKEKFVAWSSDAVSELNISDQIDGLQGRQRVSETVARADLADFLNERGVQYSGGISSPNKAFSAGSRLSAHLAWGTLSLRTCFHETMDRMGHLKADKSREAIQWKKSLRSFQSRLHWHDHFVQRLESEPTMEFTALNPAYKSVQYLESGDELQARLTAWRHGQTGIPLMDACMRCLMTTGFLNFRMRAMLVTTACFGFQIHWRELLHPLAQVFADYEPGIHISQIQMQAGMVGINTLRVYSPHKQLLDQDPDALFVKRWVPELQEFSAEEIARYETQSLGDYVAPITNITANAKTVKDQLYAIRRSEQGMEAAKTTLELHGSRSSPNDRTASSRSKCAGKSAKPRTRNRPKKRGDSDAAQPDEPGPQLSFDW